MTEQYYLSTDGGLTSKGPIPFELIKSYYFQNRISSESLVSLYPDREWNKVGEFLSSDKETYDRNSTERLFNELAQTNTLKKANFLCPRCGDQVFYVHQKAGGPSSIGIFGIAGILVRHLFKSASGSCICKSCGALDWSEFSSKIRNRYKIVSTIKFALIPVVIIGIISLFVFSPKSVQNPSPELLSRDIPGIGQILAAAPFKPIQDRLPPGTPIKSVDHYQSSASGLTIDITSLNLQPTAHFFPEKALDDQANRFKTIISDVKLIKDKEGIKINGYSGLRSDFALSGSTRKSNSAHGNATAIVVASSTGGTKSERVFLINAVSERMNSSENVQLIEKIIASINID